jgi:hypothetical protein
MDGSEFLAELGNLDHCVITQTQEARPRFNFSAIGVETGRDDTWANEAETPESRPAGVSLPVVLIVVATGLLAGAGAAAFVFYDRITLLVR